MITLSCNNGIKHLDLSGCTHVPVCCFRPQDSKQVQVSRLPAVSGTVAAPGLANSHLQDVGPVDD